MNKSKQLVACVTSIALLTLTEITFAQTLTRGPYLQTGTPTSMIIRWRTSTPADSRVQFGNAPGNLTSMTDDATSTTEHQVQLEGLTPDTKYYYSIGTTSTVLAGDDADHFFFTAPPPGVDKSTRVWLIGDAGTADNNQRAVRDAYYNFTGNRHTDLWIMLGDNAYSSGTDSEYQTAVFQNMYEAMLRKSVLWPTRGNHDSASPSTGTGAYYDIFTLPKNGEAGGLASGTEVYYSFDYGNIHFICLESTSSSYSVPNSAMLTWLQADLAANDKKWTIAFWHHPPYSKGSHDSDEAGQLTEMRQNVLPILEAGGVDVVLSGHSHSYERSFLLDGHYGNSTTLTETMKIDAGNGREDGSGAYKKNSFTPITHAGAVYVVAGSSGKTSSGPLNHPVMITSLKVLGSVVLDIDANRLDATFIDNLGATQDYFTMVKGPAPGPATQLVVIAGDNQTAPAGTPLPNPFVVEARDATNVPVPNVPVTFAVASGGGSLSNSQPQMTGANGRASTILTLGATSGSNTVTASVTDLPVVPVSFTATGDLIPSINSFNPSKAQVGAIVTITGNYFSTATQVAFNGVPASNFTIDSNTQISATVPSGATTGKISVTTPDGAGFSAGNFTVQYVLTATISGSGNVTFNPAGGIYDAGSNVTLTATPDAGFQFSGWSGDLTGAANPLTITMNANKNVTATFTEPPPVQLTVNVVGPGMVTSNPSGGSYPAGTVVALTALPNAGYEFSGWSGDLTGTANPANITMSANKTVTATFSAISPDVIFIESKTGSSSSALTVSTSSSLTAVNGHLYLAAIAARVNTAVSTVSGLGLTWTRVKAQCSGRNNTNVEIWMALGTSGSNGNVTATFVSKPSNAVIAVSRYSGAAAVSPLGNIISGNTKGLDGTCSGGADKNAYSFNLTTTVNNAMIFSAAAMQDKKHTPGAGYTERAEILKSKASVAVMDKKVASHASAIVNGTISGSVDWAVAAVEVIPQSSYVPKYTLTINTAGSGNVTLAPSGGTYSAGTIVTLTANPLAGYEFSGWSGDLAGAVNPTTIVMDANKNVTATFTALPPVQLTTDVVGAGSLTLNPAGGTYPTGTVVTLTANPGLGYQFSGWSGDLTGAANPTTLTMSANKSVTATFTELPPAQLSVTVVGPGAVNLNPAGNNYPAGTVVTLEAIPHPGAQFNGWSGDLTGTTNPATMTMNANKNVTATFSVIIPEVVYQETKTGGSTSSTQVSTSASLTAANGHLYLAAITTKPKVSATTVSGLGLTWTLVKAQCAGRSQTGMEIWKAQGTPSGNGAVTATFASVPSNAAIAVSRYSGVSTASPLGNVVSANTLGLNGACTGGSDNAAYSMSLATTANNAVVFAAAAMRNKTHTPGAGYTERIEFIQNPATSSGAGLAVEEKTIASPAAVTVNGTFSSTVDWAVVAVEIKPATGTPSPNALAKETAAAASALPSQYQLEQNHPNPFNPTTTLRYSLPQAGDVRLAIYDLNGRIVTVLAEGFRDAGSYSQTWSAVDAQGHPLPSGIYFGELRAGSHVATIRMLLVR